MEIKQLYCIPMLLQYYLCISDAITRIIIQNSFYIGSYALASVLHIFYLSMNNIRKSGRDAIMLGGAVKHLIVRAM